jgi:hypothetical protein
MEQYIPASGFNQAQNFVGEGAATKRKRFAFINKPKIEKALIVPWAMGKGGIHFPPVPWIRPHRRYVFSILDSSVTLLSDFLRMVKIHRISSEDGSREI